MKYCLHNCKLKTKHTGFRSLPLSACRCTGSSFLLILFAFCRHNSWLSLFSASPFILIFIVRCVAFTLSFRSALCFKSYFSLCLYLSRSLSSHRVAFCALISRFVVFFSTMGNTLVKIIYSRQYITKSEKE